MVQSMADYSFYNYRVMFLFWVFIGLSALFIRRTSLPESGALQGESAAVQEKTAVLREEMTDAAQERGADRGEQSSRCEDSGKTDEEDR